MSKVKSANTRTISYTASMRVRNASKKTVLVDKVRVAESLKDKILGLLSSTTPEVILFRTRFGIHTFGLNYAIDVAILDDKSKVVSLKASLPPNRVFLWNPRYDTVLEMPEGMIEKTRTALGDIIEFI